MSDAKDVHGKTTSITRGFSDLDVLKFAGFAFFFCAVRTSLQQPLTLALARKQVIPSLARLSALAILKGTLLIEGWAGLVHGMLAYVAGCAFSEAIYLVLYELLREQLPIHADATREALSGYSADAGCRLVHIPLLVISYRQMTYNCRSGSAWDPSHPRGVPAAAPEYRSIRTTTRQLLREGGAPALFAGLGTTLLLGCQWTAAWWALYVALKKQLYGWGETTSYQQGVAALLGHSTISATFMDIEDNVVFNTTASVVASAATGLIFNPFLVLRAKMQVQGRGMLMAARDVFRSGATATGGLKAFFRGSVLNVTICVIDGALASLCYEQAKKLSSKN